MSDESTEIWFEDPCKWGHEILDAVVPPRFVFTERTLGTHTSYRKWLDDWFKDQEWKALVVRKDECLLAGAGAGLLELPAWEYSSDLTELENLCKTEEFVVVRITGNKNQAASAARELARFQKTVKTTLHVMGLYESFPLMFGLGLRSVSGTILRDIIQLPTGRQEKVLSGAGIKWAMILGFLPKDLEVPAHRIMYNARSYAYASLYWTKNVGLPTMSEYNRNWTGAENALKPEHPSPQLNQKGQRSTDKITCNECSGAQVCAYHRVDSVCSLPGSDVSTLARHFQTRDAESVITGLSEMMTRGVERFEQGREQEETLEELNPEVSRIFDSLFEKGVKLAKLMDPSLNKPSVGVTVNTGSRNELNFNPKAMVADVVRELEARGIPRDQITPEMMAKMLGAGNHGQQPVIDVIDPRSPGKW